MKKRLVSFAMALVFLCMAFSSCGKTETPEREMVITQGHDFFWNDLYFYVNRTVMDDKNSTTLKYINLKTDDTVGVPVYGDLLNEGGDPFNPKAQEFGRSLASSVIVLVDEEATEKNGGIPVLIAALPFEMAEDKGTGEYHYRLVSYNMGTGKMDILCENIGSHIVTIALYRENIYFIQVTGFPKQQDVNIYDPSNELDEYKNLKDALYVLPKEGGKPKKVPLSIDEARFDLCCTWKGKIYLQTEEANRIYRYDIETQETEPVCNVTPKGDPLRLSLLFIGGYVYYEGNEQVIPKEGYHDSWSYTLYRQPLERMQDLNEKNGEVVLQNIGGLRRYQNGTKILYDNFSDGHPFLTSQRDFSVLRWYDTETKETGIVFDHSDKQGIFWMVSEISDDYIIMSSCYEDFEDYWLECIFDRKTGERRELEDNQWKYEMPK